MTVEPEIVHLREICGRYLLKQTGNYFKNEPKLTLL